ncbi:glutaredoxin family protein [Clostridium sp. JN-9]|uniref:glutaredoxin family protein n=1 Tax=Clostridium sp. JN-9 TaxID=2507159 RepID=UPI000FFE24EC|nr:glutaredoxin family protein [Clostridium sp. JN-9]QAT38878.1 glutaredoxin family protein [Clostridium sp. JN-9]
MKNVMIYTSDSCVYCKMAKEYFHTNNIEFQEKNIKEPAARKELMSMGMRSVPVIKIDDEVILGFDQEKIENALKA